MTIYFFWEIAMKREGRDEVNDYDADVDEVESCDFTPHPAEHNLRPY